MSAEYRFTIDRSDLEGKQGILKCGPDGYYDNVLVGVFNVTNAAGERYIFDDDIKNMLDSGLQRSWMTKWLAQGKLIGEREHPFLADFITKERDLATAKMLWIRRNGELSSANMAMQFAGLDCREMPDRVDGRRVYGVYAKIRPVVDSLKASLDDVNANTAFSLRSFISRVTMGIEIVRKCTNIFTYDWVTLNGIARCDKFHQPGLESEGAGIQLTQRIVTDINELFEEESLILGRECSSGIVTQVIKDCGKFREVPDLTHTMLLGRQLKGSNIYLGK